MLFKLIPEKENDRVIMRNGGVRFPKSVFPYDEKNYGEVENTLLSAGFSNVNCINLHDVTLGLFQKPGRIESITVNGVKLMSGGKVYYPDVPITITYHGR